MADEPGLANESARWKKILSQWPELTVDPESGFMFAPGFPYNESHRHFSHLMGFHPLGLVDFSDGKGDIEIVSEKRGVLILDNPFSDQEFRSETSYDVKDNHLVFKTNPGDLVRLKGL